MANIHLHPIMLGIVAPIVPSAPTQREIATRQLRQEQEAALALYNQIKDAPIGTWVALESLDSVNDFKLCNVLKSVVRSRYELDKYWKITGINLRRAVGVSKT